MPTECDYLVHFSEEVRFRVRFRQEGNHITEFLVHSEWLAVVRYDSAHGRPHKDTLDRWGREIDKEWLPGTFNQGLTLAQQDLRLNWERYLSDFMED
ncbi:MAG: hypothetical protein M3440_14705 [Chloroflexota bacterium]|nr:hypothetical protein [Chloroflexota bacterium]